MSNDFVLHAEGRNDIGKGASRRLRRLEARIPGIVYGGNAEPQMITLELREMVKALESESFYSQILTLEIDGKAEKAVLRDLQRHPSKGTPLHADFMRVDSAHKITMSIPLHILNEEKCVGVKQQGGLLYQNASEVEVSCLPQDLPQFLEVDVAALELDQVIHLSDLKLPENVELVALIQGEGHDLPVVSVQAPRGGAGDEDEDDTPDEESSES
ncbi:50S ribosomal protein L25/general stress protein Ctc [Alcanivorax quisquiliarum]|uniref:Large ribosomal subunit protein bL25 n=1 Tax=Alcanivorax quisquiliarum TaxID=2933565 RepID=A0ABT0E9W0_9GAMM|nr:50S ribosomal protein L25/general stress protein Ctc [Alcanivorax quisquiliarum]MCK0538636.1 50S ribosomal protein L25/general stress protein Ctc [Alcanivorax quisquiliarum]